MGPVARSWFACLAVVFSACSAIVDFPEKAPVPDAGEELDARVDVPKEAGPDAEPRDARADAGRDSTAAECAKDVDCDNNELCCPTNNVQSCVASNVTSCTACGVGCTDPRAPNCGARLCECVAGTGKACDPGQTCDVSSGAARCVECAGDSDCVGVTGKTLCEDNKCVACQRGANKQSPADDKGCMDGRFPFCGEGNTCIGCDDTKPETKCAEGTVCSPGVGCGGCKADVQTVGLNGCTMESLPICKTTTGGATQCQACMTNAECKLAEGQGYCATGRCSNKCDGDGALGANGCTNPATPFCKPASNVPGGFDCAACTDADCTNGTFCATTGAKAGSCVQCRVNSNCNQSGLAPICDATTFTCRARTMADCAAPTPYLSTTGATAGTCVACLNDTQCTTGLHCSPTTNTCVECAESSQCPLAKPTCNPATSTCVVGCSVGICAQHAPATMCVTGTCVECTSDLQCGNERPLCEAGACKACDAVTTVPPSPTPDARCSVRTPSSACLTGAAAGAYKGRCGNCIPGVTACTAPATCNATTLLCQ